MPGPPADPESRKSQKTARPGGYRYLPVAGRQGPAPKLPPNPRRGQRWLKETRDAWALWWASPQALEWVDADRPVLVRLARLLDAHLRDPDNLKLVTELRLLEDRLVLTPKSRDNSKIVVDRSLAAPEPEETGETGARPRPAEDPRLRLVQ